VRRAVRRFGLLLAVAAAGCLSRAPVATHSFSIDPPAPRTAAPSKGVVVQLARVEVSPPYSGQRLVYQTGDHEFERDPYARFIAPPAWLLTIAIRGYLANADFVRDVWGAGRGARPDVFVDVAVTQLSGELRDGGASARIALRVRAIPQGEDGRRGSEILLKTYSKAIPIARPRADDVVDGWNRGLAEIMAEVEADLRATLAASGVTAGSGAPPPASPGP
jgi:ABC-type uncharacterized transport system auxiliary subunit